MYQTPRDLQLLDLLLTHRALTDTQIQTALFSPTNDAGCQRRLTKLSNEHWIDRLPRTSVNEPYVYLLSRKSVVGNRLLKARWGETAFHQHWTRIGSLSHLLSINDVRVRVGRAVSDLGFTLKLWQRPEELAPILKPHQLVPDGYFQIERLVDGQPRTAGFFLELERSVKTSQYLGSKLSRYSRLYHSGDYHARFGIRGLRVLVVFTSEAGRSGESRVAKAVEQAQRLGVTLAFFANLDQLKAVQPKDILTSPLWWQANQPGSVALY